MKRTLKEWRAKEDYTQAKLASIIGVRPTTISDWEKGKSHPRYANLEKLSEVFNTDIGNIIFLSTNRNFITNLKKSNKTG